MRDRGKRRVVVTGMGVVSPAGLGLSALWSAIVEARSHEALLPDLDEFAAHTRIFGPVLAFDPEESGLPPEVIARNDRYAWFGLAAAEEALSNSRLLEGPVDRERVGVNLGTAIAGAGSMENGFLEVTNGAADAVDTEMVVPHLYQYMCPSTLAVEFASLNGLQGPCHATVTGCAAGLDCVADAWHTIRAGDADAIIAGAADAPLVPISVASFDVIGALSGKGADRVGTASAPFSGDRDGFVLAEGAGVIVLEELGHAVARDASILAEVTACASTSNSFHMTGLPPDGADLSRAIDQAMGLAGVAPSDIDWISAHGSSTEQNDRNETAAFHGSFGRDAPRIPVSSLKSMLGHPLGAASTIELAAVILCMQRDYIAPTINYRVPAADCDLDYVPNRGRQAPVATVLKDAASFSGIHTVVIVSRWSDESVHDTP